MSLEWIPADAARYGIVGVVACGMAYALYARRFKRFATIDDIPPIVWKRKRPIRAIVTSVGDGDNFRCFHKPALRFWERIPQKVKSENTIGVRLAGVDAPECAHFGKEGQPFGEEAKLWLRERLVGRTVIIEPYARDQYHRMVGMVWVAGFWKWHNVSKLLIDEGFGTVYTGSQAVYGNMLPKLEKAEARAQARRKGMWKQGSAYKSPMDFKREQRAEE